jgi:hypothetical protein
MGRQNGTMSVSHKLQIKPGQRLVLLNVPDEVDLELPSDIELEAEPGASDAVILFVANRADLQRRSTPLIAWARRDKLSWVAYPKGGQLGTDLNRDSLNDALKAQGVQAVRQVSLDDTWSALRLRPL